MKKILLFVVTVSFISCSPKITISKTSIQKQGHIHYQNYFINFEDTMLLPFTNKDNNIWFEDSCVIIEMKVFNNNFNGDIFVRRSYDFYKFTYFDLRTMSCQDYYNFSDTSLPFCNYKLKPDEILYSKFYSEKKKSDVSNNMIALPDTIIQNKNYKQIRMLFETESHEYDYEYVCFLDCSTKTIFHLNRTLDELYPDCQVTKVAIKSDLKNKQILMFEYNLLNTELTDLEKEIFRKWRVNAAQTNLPVLTYDEALKISIKMNTSSNSMKNK